MATNPMKEITIEKLVINCCVGESGDRLSRAVKVLTEIAGGQKPVLSRARMTIRSFGIRRNEAMAAHVTVRGELSHKILALALRAKEGELQDRNFSSSGHFGFGIQEHIDLDIIKYDPAIGIYGMDFFVVLTRRGFRTSRKKYKRGVLGLHHKISKEDAQDWFLKTFSDARIK
jgi:large subunit ribosomal protein L11e